MSAAPAVRAESAEAMAAAERGLIVRGLAALELADDDRAALLAEYGNGARRVADLTPEQRHALLGHLNACLPMAPVAPRPAPPVRRVRQPGEEWTTREDGVLRARYPTGGVAACREQLPGRSTGAICARANRIGLRRLAQVRRGGRPMRWAPSDEIDERIRAVYLGGAKHGAVGELAKALGWPRWAVRRRAAEIGAVPPRGRQAPWSEAEVDLLRRHAHCTPVAIARLMREAGYARTATAITVQRKRLALTRTDAGYTANQLAGLLGVDGKTVTRWIVAGWLDAERRGTERLPQQGGDHWLIERAAVREFIRRNPTLVPMPRVNGTWLIELLAGSVAP